MNTPKGCKPDPIEDVSANNMHSVTEVMPGTFCDKTIDQLLSGRYAIQQPIYDEAKERASCRASWEKTGVGVVFADYWAGWQSRAKSVEVGDE